MRYLIKILFLGFAFFCLAESRVEGSESVKVFTEDSEIRYLHPNDDHSSISVVFSKREPLQHTEEWVIIACITRNPFGYCGISSTTNSSSLTKVKEALSGSLDAFQNSRPNAVIPHIFCSNFITSETLKSFQKWVRSASTVWVRSASTVKGNVASSKLLQDRLRTFDFEPLTSELNTLLKTRGYKISGISYAVEPGKILIPDTRAFLEHLTREESYYYIELQSLRP